MPSARKYPSKFDLNQFEGLERAYEETDRQHQPMIRFQLHI